MQLTLAISQVSQKGILAAQAWQVLPIVKVLGAHFMHATCKPASSTVMHSTQLVMTLLQVSQAFPWPFL